MIPLHKIDENFTEGVCKLMAQVLGFHLYDNGANKTFSNSLHFYNNHTFCNPYDKDIKKACFKFLAQESKDDYNIHYCTIMISGTGDLSVFNSSNRSGNRLMMSFAHIDFQRTYVKLVDELLNDNYKPNMKSYTGDVVDEVKSYNRAIHQSELRYGEG